MNDANPVTIYAPHHLLTIANSALDYSYTSHNSHNKLTLETHSKSYHLKSFKKLLYWMCCE